jgi:hypothetical protein
MTISLDQVYIPSTKSRGLVPYDPVRGASSDVEETLPDENDLRVLILRRVFDRNNCLLRTKLDVKSPLIRSILVRVVEDEAAALQCRHPSIYWPNGDVFRWVR